MLKEFRKKMFSAVCKNMVKGALTIGILGASLNPALAMEQSYPQYNTSQFNQVSTMNMRQNLPPPQSTEIMQNSPEYPFQLDKLIQTQQQIDQQMQTAPMTRDDAIDFLRNVNNPDKKSEENIGNYISLINFINKIVKESNEYYNNKAFLEKQSQELSELKETNSNLSENIFQLIEEIDEMESKKTEYKEEEVEPISSQNNRDLIMEYLKDDDGPTSTLMLQPIKRQIIDEYDKKVKEQVEKEKLSLDEQIQSVEAEIEQLQNSKEMQELSNHRNTFQALPRMIKLKKEEIEKLEKSISLKENNDLKKSAEESEEFGSEEEIFYLPSD